jgi:hypothetical protein
MLLDSLSASLELGPSWASMQEEVCPWAEGQTQDRGSSWEKSLYIYIDTLCPTGPSPAGGPLQGPSWAPMQEEVRPWAEGQALCK